MILGSHNWHPSRDGSRSLASQTSWRIKPDTPCIGCLMYNLWSLRHLMLPIARSYLKMSHEWGMGPTTQHQTYLEIQASSRPKVTPSFRAFLSLSCVVCRKWSSFYFGWPQYVQLPFISSLKFFKCCQLYPQWLTIYDTRIHCNSQWLYLEFNGKSGLQSVHQWKWSGLSRHLEGCPISP